MRSEESAFKGRGFDLPLTKESGIDPFPATDPVAESQLGM
jgi:hypothetical protein